MDDSIFKDILILAIRDVEEPNGAAQFRRIQRWYSTTFHTPLPQVETMSEYDVMRTYYEHSLLTMKEHEDEKSRERYEELIANLIKDDAEITDEEAEDDAWAEELNREVAEQDNKPAQNLNLNGTPEEIFRIGGESDSSYFDK